MAIPVPARSAAAQSDSQSDPSSTSLPATRGSIAVPVSVSVSVAASGSVPVSAQFSCECPRARGGPLWFSATGKRSSQWALQLPGSGRSNAGLFAAVGPTCASTRSPNRSHAGTTAAQCAREKILTRDTHAAPSMPTTVTARRPQPRGFREAGALAGDASVPGRGDRGVAAGAYGRRAGGLAAGDMG